MQVGMEIKKFSNIHKPIGDGHFRISGRNTRERAGVYIRDKKRCRRCLPEAMVLHYSPAMPRLPQHLTKVNTFGWGGRIKKYLGAPLLSVEIRSQPHCLWAFLWAFLENYKIKSNNINILNC